MKIFEIANWFKFNFKKHVINDKSKNHYYKYSSDYWDFNFFTDRWNTIKHKYNNRFKCNISPTSCDSKYNIKVEENSNPFFRNHAPDVALNINDSFGKNSLYSSIGNLIEYKNDDFPTLKPPLVKNIALAVKHLESGYKDVNSMRIKVEEEVNTRIKDLDKCKKEIEAQIKEIIKLNKFTYKQTAYLSLPNTSTVQNIYNSSLFSGIVQSIRDNNYYLKMGYDFVPRKNEKGEDLSRLEYVSLYFISQTDESNKYMIALGSEENINNLKSEIEELIQSTNVEFK